MPDTAGPADCRTATTGAVERPRNGLGEALGTAWRKSGGTGGILVASSPTLVFVAASTLGGLTAAVVAAAVTAVATFAYRLARHEALGGALAGLVVAAVCALLAALTGEARGFFLLPTLLPAVILLVCLATVIARRPLTGLLLNRVAGGPPNWRHQRRLLRVYDISTLIAVLVNAVNFALQAFFYAADEPLVLAAAHIATGPVFATLVAGTLLAVRRTISRDRAAVVSANTQE